MGHLKCSRDLISLDNARNFVKLIKFTRVLNFNSVHDNIRKQVQGQNCKCAAQPLTPCKSTCSWMSNNTQPKV